LKLDLFFSLRALPVKKHQTVSPIELVYLLLHFVSARETSC
jgi:hypothetical protein